MRNLLSTAAAAAFVAAAPAIAAPVSYSGSQGTVQFNVPTVSSNGLRWSGQQYINPTTVIYDSATGTYTVRDTGNPAVTSTFTGGVVGADYTTFTKSSGGVTQTLKVLNKANTLVPLTYVQYGKWRRDGQSGLYAYNDTYVVFGTKTARSAIPTSGTANYTTVHDGTYLNKNGVYSVSGMGTFTANFGAGTISYDATLTGTPEAGGAAINFGTVGGNGSISRGGFTGRDLSYNAQGFLMDVKGNFYGPAAEEVGGIFALKGSSSAAGGTGSGTGAFAGN